MFVVCLDGSLPAYHLHRGFGAGKDNWLLQFEGKRVMIASFIGWFQMAHDSGFFVVHLEFCARSFGELESTVLLHKADSKINPFTKKFLKTIPLPEYLHTYIQQLSRIGGGWCNDLRSCFERAKTRRGSTRYMTKLEVFSGILSNNATLNPEEEGIAFSRSSLIDLTDGRMDEILELKDFYNWNRVKLRYCDGASFTGDAVFTNKTTTLHFKGQKIWEAIIDDLLPQGLGKARKALLSGCSAGGLATFHHCDRFAKHLPTNASVKCLSDAGFFLTSRRDISLNHTMRFFVKSLVQLQGVEQNLNRNCTRELYFPDLCFFPQYALKYISTPYFILNSAYDVYQFHHILVPTSADLHGHWNRCKLNPTACTADQIDTLQGFRLDMLGALNPFYINSRRGGCS
ncbi:hypothetical protein ACSQ67_014095 [Phaseolus vulgaris]